MEVKPLSKRYWIRYLVILIVWVVIISISAQGATRLNDQVQSSTNIISTDTEAARASDFYHERFGISGSQVEHIIMLQLPADSQASITDFVWSNYTYYMSLFIFSEMNSSGYNMVQSAPIIEKNLQGIPNAAQIASELVSSDNTTTMIFLSSNSLDIDKDEPAVKQDVHEIRDLLENRSQFYDYLAGLEAEQSLPADTLKSLLPSDAEIKNLTKILTGTPANIVDTLEVSDASFRQSEIIAAIVIIVILTLVFRTPLGVVIPLISTIAALLPAYLISSFLGQADLIVVNSFLPSVIAMIGIAVAVDYNLFILVRYREEYRKRRAALELDNNWNKETRKQTQVESAKVMNSTAGSAIMYSGFTVIIGFAALLISGNEFSEAMAIGVSVVVFVSIMATRTMTPALLSLIGRFLDWPNFMSRARQDVENYKTDQIHASNFWINWSKRVMKFPWTFLIIGLLILTPFVVLSSQTELSFSLTKSLPADTESREGFQIIQDKFNLGAINPYRIVIDGGVSDNSIFKADLISTINEFARDISNFSMTYDGQKLTYETITSLSVIQDPSTGQQQYLNLTQIQGVLAQPDVIVVGYNGSQPIYQPNWNKILFTSHAKDYINWERGNNTMVIELTSNLDPGSAAAWELSRVLKDKVNDYFTSLENDGTIRSARVTGLTATIEESSAKLYSKVPLMLTVAVILIFIALLILFRSVILPLKAIITIAGSILFGLGALVYVFQHGNIQLIEVFNTVIWQADTSGITYFLPTFLFTTILGLGMDYSIFIISRIKEEYEESGDMTHSVSLGLSKTAGVVTSAATIMTLTFMVFALSPMLTLKMMGLAMAIAITVDATVARTILLPAAMKLAGKYNFWLPKWLQKILPKVDISH